MTDPRDDLGPTPTPERSPLQVFLAGGGAVRDLGDAAAEILRDAEKEWQARQRRRST
ncbi:MULTISPECIES: hypothetical protein [Lentzea]|uniref:Uncharacterized protein n=1 Tax=Lentzea sokolovensis TaxID=3095429 RepID=A0ABU4ULV5_9PSEU|nr:MULTISPECIES: hypothetical protein [Lentzea]MDX8140485.1 hypothetical protein [Lentzea sp. BCCO 10_0061]